MSNDRYERIRAALAMGPTPGPWEIKDGRTDTIENAQGYPVCTVHHHPYERYAQGSRAAYISACDPDTIRELLDERDQLAAALEAAREDAWQPIETCPNSDRVVMFCDERQNIWTDCACDRSAAATGFYATHWRPLPAPPAIDQARGKAGEA